MLRLEWKLPIQNVSLLIAMPAKLLTLSPVFAPVALLMPYDTIDEAIQIANGTRYGLGASVFGPDQKVCVAVAKRLECGMVSINDFGVFYVSRIRAK